MRLRLSDVDWVWPRISATDYRALRTTSVDYRVLQLAYVDFSFLRAAAVRTRLVQYQKQFDSVSSSDSVFCRYAASLAEATGVSDISKLHYTRSERDSTGAVDASYFGVTSSFFEPCFAADTITFTYRAGLSDSAGAGDVARLGFTVVLRDAVFAVSAVDLDGSFFYDSQDTASVRDVLRSHLVFCATDHAGSDDRVAVGLRYLVEFYFGGPSFGGGPFGGRIL